LAEPVSADQVEELIKELQDGNSSARAEAAVALGSFGHDRISTG
jgi:HEAT repeat protein